MAKIKEQKPDAPEQKPVDIQNDEFRGKVAVMFSIPPPASAPELPGLLWKQKKSLLPNLKNCLKRR